MHLSGQYSKVGDEWVGPAKIYVVTLQKGSIRDFHENGGDVDWKVILPYWQNGKMASKLWYSSDGATIIVRKKDTDKTALTNPLPLRSRSRKVAKNLN